MILCQGRSRLHLTHVTFSPDGEEILMSYSGEHVYLMDLNQGFGFIRFHVYCSVFLSSFSWDSGAIQIILFAYALWLFELGPLLEVFVLVRCGTEQTDFFCLFLLSISVFEKTGAI